MPLRGSRAGPVPLAHPLPPLPPPRLCTQGLAKLRAQSWASLAWST